MPAYKNAHRSLYFALPLAAALLSALAWAATADAASANRITKAIDANQRRTIAGSLHPLAQPQFDRGAIDAAMPIEHMILVTKPSAFQQQNLDQLLANQQNPSSPDFRKWLTPEQFGDRFGLSQSDHGKVAQWLTNEGFTVDDSARGRNWLAFTGTAGQVSRSLHTSIHRFQVAGKTHFANIGEPSVPEAIADVTGGFLGLNDFKWESLAKIGPAFSTASGAHYLAPEDYATIYDLNPLYQAGYDGTGQSIAIVGQSNFALSDFRAFKTRFKLPANDPKVVFYGGTDPGFNGAEGEADLDLQWAGAIAPKAALTYVYGASAFTATITAINSNIAPVISISYGGCELNNSISFRAFFQQANAQGITVVVSSGDSGAAGCDPHGSALQAANGNIAAVPAALPEATAVGGTQFDEGNGTYWRAANSANGGSALSYIPERAWNEADQRGLITGGGGLSTVYPRPSWQNVPGVPPGNFRAIPDVSLTAALHDGYLVYSGGGLVVYGGTSASAPSLAGMLALLNQYQVKNGFQKQPGLGNINPQLYRLAQSSPSAFHDITVGDILVPCVQGSADCSTGFIGYSAGPGYDLATGLGTIDANNLVTSWNTATANVNVTLTVDTPRVTLNDTVTATARVTAASGTGLPSGTIDFSIGGIPFRSVPLTNTDGQLSATVAVPVGNLGGLGTAILTAQYSGDAAFNSGGATARVQITAPLNASAVILSGPTTVRSSTPADPQNSSYQTTLILREIGGVPAVITGFTIDGQPQSLDQYFPTTQLPANSTLSVLITLKNLPTGSTRTFGITGIDASGVAFSRQTTVTYFASFEYSDFSVTAIPSVISQDRSNPSCLWPVRLNLADLGGFDTTIIGLFIDFASYTSRITSTFGTSRLQQLSSLQGTLCLNDATVGKTALIEVDLSNGNINQTTVTFAGPPANPGRLTVAPATVSLSPGLGKTAQATVAINLSDATQPWTAAVTPANRTAGFLTISPASGVGSGQITLTAAGGGFAPGAYAASLTIQTPNAQPQSVTVPVIFINGASTTTIITGVGNAASPGQPLIAPGDLITIVGSQLANTTQAITATPLPYITDGVSATVNGIPAPLLFLSPNQINLQVPYGAGAGPGVIGLRNNGEIAGFPVRIAPAAPGIFTDPAGNLLPVSTVAQNGALSLYLTGVGDVTGSFRTAYAASSTANPANLPKPLLPVSATVGGAEVFIQFAGLAPGLVGVTQVNLILPQTVPLGLQDVVIAVNGVRANTVKVNVLPPAASTTQP